MVDLNALRAEPYWDQTCRARISYAVRCFSIPFTTPRKQKLRDFVRKNGHAFEKKNLIERLHDRKVCKAMTSRLICYYVYITSCLLEGCLPTTVISRINLRSLLGTPATEPFNSSVPTLGEPDRPGLTSCTRKLAGGHSAAIETSQNRLSGPARKSSPSTTRGMRTYGTST
jgi:hypothetical protein